MSNRFQPFSTPPVLTREVCLSLPLPSPVIPLIVMLIASAAVFAPAKVWARNGQNLAPETLFYVPKPNQGAKEQIAGLISSGNKADADLIREMIDTPQAVWFTRGTPKSIEQDKLKENSGTHVYLDGTYGWRSNTSSSR